MRYVSTGGATADTAARSLAGLRTSMGKEEVRFESGWELQKRTRKCLICRHCESNILNFKVQSKPLLNQLRFRFTFMSNWYSSFYLGIDMFYRYMI